MYLTQKPSLIEKSTTRAERKRECRKAYEAYQKKLQESLKEGVKDFTKSDPFQTLFRRSWYLRDKEKQK